MTEEAVTNQKTQVATPAELAAAREARGMSQVDISQRIKLQVKQVNALEEGQWDSLPGKSFVRGALRSYGKLLDVDVGPLLESIGGFAEPAQVSSMRPLDTSISRSAGLGFNGGGRGSPILWVIAGLIGVVALVLYFGSDGDSSRIRSWLPSGGAPSGTTVDPAPAPPAPSAPAPSSGAAPSPGRGAADASQSPRPSPDASPDTSPAASPGTSPAASTSTPSSSQPRAAAPGASPAANALTGGQGSGSGPGPVLSALSVLPNKSPASAAGAPATSPPPAPDAASGSAAGAAGNGLAGIGASAGAASPAPSASPAGGGPVPRQGTTSAMAPSPSMAAAAKTSESAPSSPNQSPADASTNAPGSASTTARDAKGQIRLKAGAQDSWVEVRQADGTALHNGLVKAGDTLELHGKPPYRLVLGNASHLEVVYEGKVQDLAPHMRAQNIARLQLK